MSLKNVDSKVPGKKSGSDRCAPTAVDRSVSIILLMERTAPRSSTIGAQAQPIFTWQKLPVPVGFDNKISIDNLSGANAINTLVWLSNEEEQKMRTDVLRHLANKHYHYTFVILRSLFHAWLSLVPSPALSFYREQFCP